ncbi:hypothetical protein FQN60_009537 [Etheostoma spectabile]|uniref:Uncharacterized protein n=1 Tax=Etheostoma spectabile TaxID=54343 RepID=A0A5J5DJB9_9PERO|nr:hypothetical protein FQN60_009537 [Etheostoma spectabile]
MTPYPPHPPPRSIMCRRKRRRWRGGSARAGRRERTLRNDVRFSYHVRSSSAKKDLELTCTKVAIFNCSCFCCILVTRALTLSLFINNLSGKLKKNPVTKL